MVCNYHDSTSSSGGSRSGQELTTGVIAQTDPLPPLDSLEHKQNNVPLMFPHRGGGHVEGFRGRGGGAGVDCAVCRGGVGLGAVDPPALRGAPAVELRTGTRPGEAPDGGGELRLQRGLIAPEASRLRSESALE